VLSRTLLAISLLLWTFLAAFGAHPPENGTIQQWIGSYFVPLFMAAISVGLLMAALQSKPKGPMGCLSATMVGLLLPYLFFYTGGV